MKSRHLISALTLCVPLTACGDGGGPAAPSAPVVGSVLLSATSLELMEGTTTQISARLFDQSGQPMSPGVTSLQWTSGDPSVASVSAAAGASATVSGVAAGVTTIAASAGGVAEAYATVSVAPDGRVTVHVRNELVGTIRIIVNGASQGTVEGGAAASYDYDQLDVLALEWTLVRPSLSDGREVGQTMGGTFTPITEPRGDIDFTVDNVVGDASFFTPIVKNESGSDLLMGVNMGLSSENRCDCVVSAGSTGTYFGYYRLFSNSNVRGYRPSNGYSGSYIYWESFASGAETGSGRVNLVATSAPPVIGRTPLRMASPEEAPAAAAKHAGPADLLRNPGS